MKFILGTKQYMTQVFDEKGNALPGTVVSAGPITVTTVKSPEKDGYASVQVGFGTQKEKNVPKPVLGQLKKKGIEGMFQYIREFRTTDTPELGSIIDVSAFMPGETVEVSGVSKGKGFQGVVKRHGFAGGQRTHGQKHSEREPGSIGGGLRTRVPKGMRMAGRMGSDRTTVKNLKVLKVLPDTNELIISGAIPGRRGTLVEITAK